MNEMHVLYVPATDHVLAAQRRVGGQTPTVEMLAGPGGFRLGCVRGPHGAADVGTATTQQERFWIGHGQLAVRTMPLVADVFERPHAFLVDTDHVAELPPSDLRFKVSLDSNGNRLVVTKPDSVPIQLKLPERRRVWIQIEGPRPVDRRVMAGAIEAGDDSPWSFPLTVEPDGPIAPIPTAGSQLYYILLLIEGLLPDVRTQTL